MPFAGHRTVLLLPRVFQPATAPVLHQRDPHVRHAQYVFPLACPSQHRSHLPCAVSLITCDLGVMLEITGGISATALAFIFPAACYLKLANPGAPWHARTKLPALCCAVFGVIVLLISLFLALGKVWTPAGDAKICM